MSRRKKKKIVNEIGSPTSQVLLYIFIYNIGERENYVCLQFLVVDLVDPVASRYIH